MLRAWSLLLTLVACAPEEEQRQEPRVRPDPEPEPSTDVFPDPVDTGTPPEPTEVLPVPGAWLLETDEVRVVDLTIGATELASLAVAPEAWVPADLKYEGITLSGIGVRLKGNGSFQPIEEKPSFKLGLDKYDELHELDGLDELVLNNMVTDASYLRERLAYAAYRELGVPAPRAVHVLVNVNGEPYGLYLMLEAVDGRFLKRWFDDNGGPLYEMFDVDLTPPEVWQLEHDGGPDDRTALVGLAAALEDPAMRVTVEGAPWLDVDQFASYFGASAVIGQFDAYPYSFPGDDVYLYVDPADARVHFVAHGADESFSDPFRPADYVFGLLAVRCLADVACEEKWAEAVWSAQDTVEAMDLAGQLDTWSENLRVHLEVEPRSPWTLQEIKLEQEEVSEFLAGRRAGLEAMPGLP